MSNVGARWELAEIEICRSSKITAKLLALNHIASKKFIGNGDWVGETYKQKKSLWSFTHVKKLISENFKSSIIQKGMVWGIAATDLKLLKVSTCHINASLKWIWIIHDPTKFFPLYARANIEELKNKQSILFRTTVFCFLIFYANSVFSVKISARIEWEKFCWVMNDSYSFEARIYMTCTHF